MCNSPDDNRIIFILFQKILLETSQRNSLLVSVMTQIRWLLLTATSIIDVLLPKRIILDHGGLLIYSSLLECPL